MSIRMVDGAHLFTKDSLRDYLEAQKENLKEAIRDIPRERVARADLDSIADELVSQFEVKVPELHDENIRVSDPTDARVDVSGDRMRHIRDRSTPTYLDGTAVTFSVLFDGESDLFKYRPSSFSMNPPRASRVRPGKIEFEYKWVQGDADVETADEQFRGDLNKVKGYLENAAEQVEDYNSSLRQDINAQLRRRKEAVEEDRSGVESLPYPVERRDDAPATHKVPVERKSVGLEREKKKSRPPNRFLTDEVYEAILEVLRNMTEVMERSPTAFREMDEEDLRTHFLVQLNGQFEGPATGETFNRKGKTDIYLPADERAVFIAECKFWKGQTKLQGAIDQLLGYSSWRDTKTALVIFNRNQNTSRVLDQIPEVFEGREDYLRTIEYGGETDFRFVLRHGGDPQREVTVTVLVFDVPTN